MSGDAHGDAQAVIDTATAAATPYPLDLQARFFAVTVPAGGELEVIDLETYREALLDRPRRKTGGYKVHDAASFVAYLNKHGDSDTEVWADSTRATITGVLNAHEVGTEARWEDHRVTYTAILTDAWTAWVGLSGKQMSQSEFAEHLEDRSIDIIEPTAADMLELAQTFKANLGVKFESSKYLSSGETQLEYRETVDAKAGRAGRMEIPQTFSIAVRPFEGADVYKVTARLRYRITDGALRLGYRLERPDDVLREAFLGVVAQVEPHVDGPILRGSR